MELIDLMEKTNFSEQFSPIMLRRNQQLKVPLICMEPGQEILPHSSGTGVFYIVSGSAVMTIEDREVEVQAGNMVFVEKNESRGIRATDNLIAFAVNVS